MSKAPDAASRLFSPVSFTDGNWFNYVNSPFEWEWLGGTPKEPMNTRRSWFPAIVKTEGVV
jgi:hypothetical protein